MKRTDSIHIKSNNLGEIISSKYLPEVFKSNRSLNYFIAKTDKLKISKWRDYLKLGEHETFFADWYLNNFTVAISKDIQFSESNLN